MLTGGIRGIPGYTRSSPAMMTNLVRPILGVMKTSLAAGKVKRNGRSFLHTFAYVCKKG